VQDAALVRVMHRQGHTTQQRRRAVRVVPPRSRQQARLCPSISFMLKKGMPWCSPTSQAGSRSSSRIVGHRCTRGSSTVRSKRFPERLHCRAGERPRASLGLGAGIFFPRSEFPCPLATDDRHCPFGGRFAIVWVGPPIPRSLLRCPMSQLVFRPARSISSKSVARQVRRHTFQPIWRRFLLTLVRALSAPHC
jgi:hypothetical protein